MKANTRVQRAHRLRRLTVVGAALAVLVTGACDSSQDASPPTGANTPVGAGAVTVTATAAPAQLGEDQYLQNPLAFNSAVDWTLSKTVKIDLSEMKFKPKDIILAAGIPYVLELTNSGAIQHEFTAAKFFRSSSVRKIATANGEVRVPYFTGVKVLPGQTVNVFAIPVVPGYFDVFCSIPGHREAGMTGTITVTGVRPAVPAPVLASLSTGPWLKNGPELLKAAEPTWDATAKTVQIEAGEGGATGMYFKPKQLVLKVGQPYVMKLVNVGTILHEYTADEFFPTVAFLKAQDSAGEYRSPLLKEAEVLAGKELDLYIIPTKTGTYKISCKLPGHEIAGMVGTIKVIA